MNQNQHGQNPTESESKSVNILPYFNTFISLSMIVDRSKCEILVVIHAFDLIYSITAYSMVPTKQEIDGMCFWPLDEVTSQAMI